jgi:hypothetical protein
MTPKIEHEDTPAMLEFLNEQKAKLLTDGEISIANVPHGKNWEFTDGGCRFEWPITGIQFYDATFNSVTSTVGDEHKHAALIHLNGVGDTLLWVRQGTPRSKVPEHIEFTYRLWCIELYG